jgi:DNA-binding CsgD family transcriptional regulator
MADQDAQAGSSHDGQDIDDRPEPAHDERGYLAGEPGPLAGRKRNGSASMVLATPPERREHVDALQISLSFQGRHVTLGPSTGHGRLGDGLGTWAPAVAADDAQGRAPLGQRFLGAEFLRLLCSQPDGNAVAFALMNGPCAAYQALACAIYLVNGERTHLALAGECGFSSEALARYQLISLHVDIPGAQAFRSGDSLVIRGHEAEERFPLLSAFFDSQPAGRECDWICLPLTYLGAGLGTIVIACPTGFDWGWTEQAHFAGFAAAVSLWARIQQSEPAYSSTPVRRVRSGSVDLSERQLQVLAGIRLGKPNKVIARELGYSVSTIKAEVQEILACLGAANRREAIARAQQAAIPLPEAIP